MRNQLMPGNPVELSYEIAIYCIQSRPGIALTLSSVIRDICIHQTDLFILEPDIFILGVWLLLNFFNFVEQEERNMGLKNQIRSKVQAELERLASGCRDMATLLRLLQIPVEGGVCPSSQQARFLIFNRVVVITTMSSYKQYDRILILAVY